MQMCFHLGRRSRSTVKYEMYCYKSINNISAAIKLSIRQINQSSEASKRLQRCPGEESSWRRLQLFFTTFENVPYVVYFKFLLELICGLVTKAFDVAA